MIQSPPVETIPLTRWDDGSIRVTGSRVRLDQIVELFEQGWRPDEIIEAFTTLRLDDAYAIIAYYLRHKSELAEYLETNRREEEAIFREHESESREFIKSLQARMKDRRTSAEARGG
jgi:uncharacterized protein (DUF433 family)